jgi:hypothetical protein
VFGTARRQEVDADGEADLLRLLRAKGGLNGSRPDPEALADTPLPRPRETCFVPGMKNHLDAGEAAGG